MAEAKKRTVLVGGATGKQGGAVVDKLLAHGHKVIAYVQPGSKDSPKAQALVKRGVTLAMGDLSDAASLGQAASAADAIFSITVPFGPKGKAGEVEQGKALVDVAAEQGKYFVYSSIAGVFRQSNDPKVVHANSKREIEEYLTASKAPHTVIAPTYLMENTLNVGFNGLKRDIFALPLSPQRRIDQTTVLDMAGMAVYALENRDAMMSKRVEIASESVTGQQIAEVFSKLLGRHIPYVQLPIEQVRQMASEEIATMFQRFEDHPYYLEITQLHATYPEVQWHTFEQWAQTVDWKKLLT